MQKPSEQPELMGVNTTVYVATMDGGILLQLVFPCALGTTVVMANSTRTPILCTDYA